METASVRAQTAAEGRPDPSEPDLEAGGEQRALRLGLFGCALDTGNLGVSALGISSVRGLTTQGPHVACTLFDYGRGRRRATLQGGGWRAPVELEGCSASRRYYRPTNLQQLHLAARLGLSRLHPVLSRLAALDGILDISGGDSFSDLYGDKRFRAVALPKQLAMALGRPLVLLPQTLGPFASPANRSAARALLLGARQVWTRDARSLEVARDLLGDDFDARRHRQGVDVAFGLPIAEPRAAWTEDLARFVDGGRPVLGLNVSGLLSHQSEADRVRFGLRTPYPELVRRLLDRLRAVPGARILLIPHVVPPCQHAESDDDAHRALLAELGADAGRAVFRVPPALSAPEAKWVVGRCDWFCGTRMHACIAALSQGIPTVGLAYSDKARGVFDTVGAGDQVVDPRRLEAEEVVGRVVETIGSADERAADLREHLAGVRERLGAQFRDILGAVAAATADGRSDGGHR